MGARSSRSFLTFCLRTWPFLPENEAFLSRGGPEGILSRVGTQPEGSPEQGVKRSREWSCSPRSGIRGGARTWLSAWEASLQPRQHWGHSVWGLKERVGAALEMKEETEQVLSWKQDSILGQTVDFELNAQYLWKWHTNWKARPPEGRAPGLSVS